MKRHKTDMIQASIVIGVLALVSSLAAAPEPALPRVNVVLFTPADVTPPPDATRRLTEVADYTEAFIVNGMKRSGYAPARSRFFDRNPDGTLRVLFVTGKEKLASGRYNKSGFEAEVRQQATPRYNLGQHRHVWWIWVYLGDPPRRFEGFKGGGSVRVGGTAFANYHHAPGTIRITDELGAPFPEAFALKGAMHELGHAFGLPHVGPLEKQAGMPLMGANIPNFRKRTGRHETRGYLSAASAAMLWKHPIFSGTARSRGVMPAFSINNLSLSYDRGTRSARLHGTLKSNHAAHSVVVLDNVPGAHEAYWQKPYVGRVSSDGRFEVAITEPSTRAGTLRLLFCFENGAISGDGSRYGIGSALEKAYRAGYVLVP
jgi:hypothetical protein